MGLSVVLSSSAGHPSRASLPLEKYVPGWPAVSMKRKGTTNQRHPYSRLRSFFEAMLDPPQKDTWRPNWISLGGSTFDVICPAPATPIKLLGTL